MCGKDKNNSKRFPGLDQNSGSLVDFKPVNIFAHGLTYCQRADKRAITPKGISINFALSDPPCDIQFSMTII